MVKKRVDPRVRELIEAGVKNGHRSMFVLVGDHGKDQVENLHKILAKTRVKSRPSVLWCYKKELGFSTHRQKRMRQIKKLQARGLHDPDQEDPFDLFISTTDIRWTYYKETDKVLGQTYGMCVLQDFESLTPNVLARTIETVEGGGLVILLMRTVKSLKQLYTMSMDVHSRFRTEACHEIIPRFNERFILSLANNPSCLVLDDELNLIPISSEFNTTSSSNTSSLGGSNEWESSVHTQDPKLVELKASLEDTPTAGHLVSLAKTLDQAQAILSFLDAISEKTMRSTVALTAARGRGKSAAIGLCLSGAIAYGYSNIFVTAPSPENLKTVFEFIIKGLEVLKYVEHMDYDIVQEHMGELGKVVVRVNIYREHRQTIQYIKPTECYKLSQAELVAIDEAAAIPLPTMKKLLGNYLVFMSSTINGYEGTGRALSLKLISQLRKQQAQINDRAAVDAGQAVVGDKKKKGVHEERWKAASEVATGGNRAGTRVLTELSLDTPIRYNSNDAVEKWMNDLLCLDVLSNSTRITSSLPAPNDCDLFLVDRDALFSYHSLSEKLLQRIWSLYTSAHYKNSPNDLQMLSDAPAHRLFVLLGPTNNNKPDKSGICLPDILCVVQVAFEGHISQKTVQAELAKGNKASGDMIPWSISQQYNDTEFATLSGARIVRVATHADVQGMGYGSRAIDLLIQYFQGDIMCMNANLKVPDIGEFSGESGVVVESGDNEDEIKPRVKLPPLLTALHERPAERLHWLGVSFGLTTQLLSFWSRKGFKMNYVRQTQNEITGEYSCIILREMKINTSDMDASKVNSALLPEKWLNQFVDDYRHRMVNLLSFTFKELEIPLALSLIDPDRTLTTSTGQTSAETPSYFKPVTTNELLSTHLSMHDIKRLELYSRNMVDHHMIMDMIPILAQLLFMGRFNNSLATGVKAVNANEDTSSLRFSNLQVAILLAMGLQHKTVDEICTELDLPSNQVLAFFNKTVRKITSHIRSMLETSVSNDELTSVNTLMKTERRVQGLTSLSTSLNEDIKAGDVTVQQKQQDLMMETNDIKRHALDSNLMNSTILEEALESNLKHMNNSMIPHSISINTSKFDKKRSNDDATPTVTPSKKHKKDKDHKKKHK